MYEKVLERIEGLRCGPRGWYGRCPCQENHVHGDRNASFELWIAPDGNLAAWCHKGCTRCEIMRATDTNPVDWFPPRPFNRIRAGKGSCGVSAEVVATYDYHDEAGVLLFQACRLKVDDGEKDKDGNPVFGKRFFQRRPMPDGGWANTLGGGWFRKTDGVWYQVQEGANSDATKFEAVRLVPFHLPFLASHPELPIIVVEGEKDVLTLEAVFAGAKICITTNPMGAKKWPWHFGKWLKGRRVTIIPDNDDVGFEHGCMVAASAISSGCESVRLVKWFEVPNQVKPGGDVTDWLEGQTDKKKAVIELCKNFTEEYKKGAKAA